MKVGDLIMWSGQLPSTNNSHGIIVSMPSGFVVLRWFGGMEVSYAFPLAAPYKRLMTNLTPLEEGDIVRTNNK